MKRIKRKVFIVVCFLVTVMSAYASSADIRVSVSKDQNGNDVLDGEFSVCASTGVAWSVLTDYDGMKNFVSSIKSSRIVKKNENNLIVEQDMSGKAGFFHKKIHLSLEVTELGSQTIAFRDTAKKSFKLYEGSWQIRPEEDHLQISYHLAAKPNFFAPDFLTRSAFRNTVQSLLEEVQHQMLTTEISQNKITTTGVAQ